MYPSLPIGTASRTAADPRKRGETSSDGSYWMDNLSCENGQDKCLLDRTDEHDRGKEVLKEFARHILYASNYYYEINIMYVELKLHPNLILDSLGTQEHIARQKSSWQLNASRPRNCPQHSEVKSCLLYTSPSPRDRQKSRMPSSA